MNRWILTVTLTLILALMAGFAYAQEPGQIVLNSIIQKEIEVVNEKGEREIKLVEAGNAIPGDELILTINYTNQGTEPAENVVLVNPVPEYTVYVADSAGGEGTSVTFSVDDGVSYGSPDSLTVTGEDGKPRAAVPDDYTHIRWVRTGSLLPGQGGNVFFRVRLK